MTEIHRENVKKKVPVVAKIFALLIAMVMVLGMSTSVFAAGTNEITVTGTIKDETYKLYKMFDLVVDD